MRAAFYEQFEGPIEIVDLPDPAPDADGVVVEVAASGLCRSDWHGWMGHDPDIALPHVPGHELAGTVVAVGAAVERWAVGDRVTVPFAAGCGSCRECRSGNEQVCSGQYQPGFSGWGSFAEFVALRFADTNLVAIPPDLDATTAAILGCRFATAFRAVGAQGRAGDGEHVVVFGAGGVGLSATMIAKAQGSHVTAVDPDPAARALASEVGADVVIGDRTPGDIAEVTRGGAHLTIDAIGNPDVVAEALELLRPGGRHVQVGLLPGDPPAVPMGRLIGQELEIIGSHGMSARDYPEMLDMISDGRLRPGALITRTIDLSALPWALSSMATRPHPGMTVIDRFDA